MDEKKPLLFPELSSLDFIKGITAEVRRGWGVVPFTGSGVSARSGILTGMDFTDYLTWVVFRCVAEKATLARVVPDEKLWNVRRHGWPRPPKTDESKKVQQWVHDHFKELCEKHGLAVHCQQGTHIVEVLTPIPGVRLKDEKPSALDADLRRPMVPGVLRKWDVTHVDDEGVRQFLRLLGSEKLVRDVLTQQNLSPDSEEAIIERAIRSLYDWRAMLEFLARLGLRQMTTVNQADSSDRPCMVERDASVIDGFNLHITRGRKPNLANTMFCHLASPLRTRIVLTTNFDNLQQDAFEQLSDHYEVIPVSIHGDLPSPDTVHSLNCILKLHGALTETRADYSLDDPPTLVDKNRFFHYICGCYPREIASEYRSENSQGQFIPNHLLVAGYSGNDARCVQMIKYVLDHHEDTKLFWICYNQDDRSRVSKIFAEEAYKSRVFLTVTERLDLLLLELYQTLTLRLPKGGFSYQYAHDVPPKLWNPAIGLEDKLKTSVETILTAVKSLPQNQNGVNKAIWVEVKPEIKDEKTISTGLTVVLHYALKQLREKEGFSVMWIEMEDFADAFALLHHILQVISLRLGLFQLEHAVLVPVHMEEMLNASTNKSEIWSKVVKRVVRYLGIQAQRYAIFFYGRNVPGMCAGWGDVTWGTKEYQQFHELIKALTATGFRVVYAPLTQDRIDRDKNKFGDQESAPAQANSTAADARELLTLGQWQKNGKWQGDFNQFEESVSALLRHEHSQPDTRDEDLFTELKCSPEHGDTPALNETLHAFFRQVCDIYKENLTDERRTELTNELHFLFTATYFRTSRPSNVFLSEPVFPSPRQFNLEGFDNDWDRMERAGKWLKSYCSRNGTLLWHKPGGNYWFFRDARLSLQYMLGHCVNPPTIRPKGLPRTAERSLVFPAQQSAWSHYWIAQWYFRAYCTTNHAVPLCESLYHLYQSLLAIPFAHQAVTEPQQEDPSLEKEVQNLQTYRQHLWLRSITEWIKILRVGRKSLYFWMDCLAAQAWFGDAVTKELLARLAEGMNQLFEIEAESPPGDPHYFGSMSYARGLLGELTLEMFSCRNEFQRKPFIPDLPLDALPPTGTSGDLKHIQNLRNENFNLAKADLFHKESTAWRKSANPDERENLTIGNWKLKGMLDRLAADEIVGEKDGRDFYKEMRDEFMAGVQGMDAYRVLPQIISVLVQLSYDHIRRAKVIEDSKSIVNIKGLCRLIPSDPEARPIWRQVNILARMVLAACHLTPPALFEFELTQRVTVLGYHGLALGHLGRFFEAHRRLNEASALLSKLARRVDTIDMAILKMRRAEVHLLEANQIQTLFDAASGKYNGKQPVYDNHPLAKIDQDAWESWLVFWQTPKDKSARTKLEAEIPEGTPRLTHQLVKRYGLRSPEEFQQMVCAKVDDAWAAIESAESLLAGRTRTSPSWGRLAALKLQILAHHPPTSEVPFRTLPTRRRIEMDEELRHLLHLGFGVWPDDPFRRIRLADYFIEAWNGTNHREGKLTELTENDLTLLNEAFDPSGYPVDLDGKSNLGEMQYHYIRIYADALRVRIDGIPKKKRA